MKLCTSGASHCICVLQALHSQQLVSDIHGGKVWARHHRRLGRVSRAEVQPLQINHPPGHVLARACVNAACLRHLQRRGGHCFQGLAVARRNGPQRLVHRVEELLPKDERGVQVRGGARGEQGVLPQEEGPDEAARWGAICGKERTLAQCQLSSARQAEHRGRMPPPRVASGTEFTHRLAARAGCTRGRWVPG